MRRTLLLAVGTALLLAPQAGAVPTAGPETAAAVAFHVPGRGPGLDVLLEAGRTATGALRLRVDLAPPGGSFHAYGTELPAGALTVGADAATLRTTLGGQRLLVSWRADDAVAVFTGVENGRDLDGAGWHAAGRGAQVTIRLGSVTCKSGGFGLLGTAVAHDAGSYGSPVATAPKLTARSCQVS